MGKILKLNDINEFITEDNASSLALFNDLRILLEDSYSNFPKGTNLIGIFFIDLLKLYTQSYLKLREIEYEIVPNELIGSRLKSWPYVGYHQLSKGLDLEYDHFGRNTSIHFVKNQIDKKHIYIVLKRFLKGMGKQKTKLSIAGSSAISSKKNLDILLNNLDLIPIKTSDNWLHISDYKEQISYLRMNLRNLLDKYFNEPICSKLIDISSQHIVESINPDDQKNLKISNTIVLGSGVEIENRMLASYCYNKGIQVINIIHGEAFGVYDEPIFGALGEQMYSSKILGYGNGILENSNSYRFIMNDINNYIPSNAETLLSIYKSNVVTLPSKSNLNYYYFPTTLRGTMHRFGPYQDMPDFLYLEWQRMLNKLFSNRLKTKLHPKEKYLFLYKTVENTPVSSSFMEIEHMVDVFVFDYIGTAFHQACATTKPVVYFDLGIRNISENAKEAVKNRTIYFDLSTGDLPSFSDINDRIFTEEKENELTKEYSLTEDDRLRSESLIQGMKL